MPKGNLSDGVVGSLLAVATVVYLGALPFNVIVPPDEAHALHQAKRLLNGEVLYRDLFDIVMPLWTYFMAGLFWLFGTTLATARLTAAVIHGLTALVVFFLCRRFGVRREIAAIAAAAQLLVCEPAYAVANRHWLETLLCVALLFWCAAPRPAAWSSFVTGVLVGLLIANHQQRGVSMAMAVLFFMTGESLLRRRCGEWRSESPWSAGAAFVGGVLCVVVPALAVVTARAGVEPVWYALVVHPLSNYRGTLHSTWARPGARAALVTLPLLLKYLPVVLPVPAARLLWLARRRADPLRARSLLLLVVFGAFAILSIAYYPDLAHVAFVAPILFIAVAETLEWALGALPRRWAAALARVALAAVLAGGGLRLAARWEHERRAAPTARQTAFGRIDLGLIPAKMYDELDALLRDVPDRTLYVHPVSRHIYLMLGARNPTRFEYVHAGSFNTDAQVQEVIEALRTQRVPYVMFTLPDVDSADPIVRFVHQRYAPLPGTGRARVWKRNDDGASAPPPAS